MAARLSTLLPTLVVLTLTWLLATSAVTFAASGGAPREAAPVPKAPAAGPEILVVPDVRKQAYVFAKGMLEDGGFAWKVTGGVKGYAANTVAMQTPAPGTRLVDTGTPTVVLSLSRNKEYAERGLPENSSRDRGTRVVLAANLARASAPPPPPAAEPATSAKPATSAQRQASAASAAKPAPAAPRRAGRPKAKRDGARKPAFVVAGAPREPRDEMPLPDRARLLERRLESRTRPTPALVRYWLYQHAWIVAGARFGWSGGAEALRTLIAVDNVVQARWGVGARSEAVARATLAEVKRRSR